MAKSDRHDRAVGAAARESSDSPTSVPAHISDRASRPLLQRILDTPHLARVVPQLPPDVLHRVIEHCGLEDCAEIVALSTPAQLAEVFDLDLWRPPQPGLDEEFDPARFGLWLEVLAAGDPAVAVEKLAAMDPDLLITAIAQLVKVYDRAALTLATEDGEELAAIRIPEEAITAEIGGCLLVARREDGWDAIVEVLIALQSNDPECFGRIMRGCRRLSNAGRELDGLDELLDDPAQAMFDLEVDREQRHEKKGYVTPAQARAFLHSARQLDIAAAVMPPPNPISRVYFEAIEPAPADDAVSDDTLAQDAGVDDAAEQSAVAEIVGALRDAGVMPQPPRALLERPGSEQPQLERIRSLLQATQEHDELAYFRRGAELAYLANVLMTGCSIQARAMTTQEAWDAVLAVCNLGLENWPRDWMVDDLTRVFEVGMRVLHRDVCMACARELVAVLEMFKCEDPAIARELEGLRRTLNRHLRDEAPWRACDSFEVLNSVDTLAWAGLLGLIGECPVLHAAVRATEGRRLLRVNPTDFEFIATNEQIGSAARFMRALPALMTAT